MSADMSEDLEPRQAEQEARIKKAKRRSRLIILAVVILVLLVAANVLAKLFAKESHGFELTLEAKRIVIPVLGGISVSETIINEWIIVVGVIIFALVFRFMLFPRFKKVPKGFQNFIELFVETITKYTKDNLEGHDYGIAAYAFTAGAYIVLSGLLELFGLRAPTTDVTATFSLAITAFFVINITALRVKGVFGRIKSYTKPNLFIGGIRLITDSAVPFSMALRLFGNMFGGLLMMDLIYMITPVGIPAAASVFFTLFHAGMQSFIFITLALAFTGEAIE